MKISWWMLKRLKSYHSTKLILVATPNNPTGTIMPKKDILAVLDGRFRHWWMKLITFTGKTMAQLVGKYKT